MIIQSKVLIQSMKTPFFSCYEEKISGNIPFSQHFPFFFQNTPKMLGKVPRISTKKDRLERTGTDNAPREIVEDKPFITELLVVELGLTLLNFLFVIKKILGDI